MSAVDVLDVLAVMDVLTERAGVLRPYAQDTGSFRVGNKGATELAAACAAAIKAAETRAAVAELVEAAEQAVGTTGVNATYLEREAVRTRLRAALARVGGGK